MPRSHVCGNLTWCCPQGSSWLHVGTDQPFISISIGACCQVWAVARDGSAFYRGAVSSSQPAGECALSPCPPHPPTFPFLLPHECTVPAPFTSPA